MTLASDTCVDTAFAVAKRALACGISALPVPANGQKHPIGNWKQFQEDRPTEEILEILFSIAGVDAGLCLICGPVSGNLEMLDFDSREAYNAYKKLAEAFGISELINRLETGYLEYTPKGVHYFYRCSEIQENQKLGRRPKLDDPQQLEVLIETRGIGGLGVVAPSKGGVHPSGEPYTLISGGVETIVTITPEERKKLLDVARSLDQSPKKTLDKDIQSYKPFIINNLPTNRLRPGEDFNNRATWEEVLEPRGWRAIRYSDGTTQWTRPGTSSGDCHATTGANGTDYLYVFSTAQNDFEPERVYDKFGAYTQLYHGGDHIAAAKELAKKGYGTTRETQVNINILSGLLRSAAMQTREVSPEVNEVIQPVTTLPVQNESIPLNVTSKAEANEETCPSESELFDNILVQADLNDAGMKDCFEAFYKDDFRFVEGLYKEQDSWVSWDGTRWKEKAGAQAFNAMANIARRRQDAFEQRYNFLTEHAVANKAFLKEKEAGVAHAVKYGNTVNIKNALTAASNSTKFRASAEDFDCDLWLCGVQNGVINLKTGEFREAKREDRITKQLGTTYDPNAKCPEWERFISSVLPEDRAKFFQRAIGYSLTGLTIERAIFLLVGQGANGKSTALGVLNELFGDYGRASKFKLVEANRLDNRTEDLARLRGARYVAIIEAEHNKRFDEGRLKSLTGGDKVVANHLYANSFEFDPQLKLFIALNQLPDIQDFTPSIWDRMKVIKFERRFEEDEQDRFLRNKLLNELPGILNWVLEGLDAWHKEGLNPPESVKIEVAKYQGDNDPVQLWLDECCEIDDTQPQEANTAFASYSLWADKRREAVLTQTRWGKVLTEKGFKRERVYIGEKRPTCYYGFRLKEAHS
jgi:putative DNA primase/helicase